VGAPELKGSLDNKINKQSNINSTKEITTLKEGFSFLVIILMCYLLFIDIAMKICTWKFFSGLSSS